MAIRLRSGRDLTAGLVFMAVGGTALWMSSDWPMGTLASMDAGYFPAIVSSLLMLLGAGVAIPALRFDGPPVESFAMRPLLLVTATVVVFAVLLKYAGLVLTIAVMTLLASFAASERRRLLVTLVLGLGLAALCVGLFVFGLGLPIPIWPRW
ncbi:MAG: tripartite tricarboxylate transporter TctB family protein [Rhodoplanes sp.]|uniref:tripartite tricarboxylate transporter TctB family protein n=1 Tax=Rhodoplanes sp. TaxID=1968906 RepID=UPI0017B8F932|nr:tripartite tricarboxylate transporter TctB family protein [Rhodoplanes sp.]NVO14369.1 tripartite tricarboxylate transporter TctB family protein [Rhodoplanes sp.]